MNTIKDTDSLMKNIELYNALHSLMLCNDNQCVFNKDDPDVKHFLFSIEAGILHGHTDHYDNERFSYIMKNLRKMYKKVSNHKMNEIFPQAQPLAQGLTPKGQTYPPSARASKNKKEQPIQPPPPPPLVYNYQTIMNKVTKDIQGFSSIAPELQNKFKNEFHENHGYDLIGDNDDEIKKNLLMRIEKDKKGGRKTKKLNKKYLKSRRHK